MQTVVLIISHIRKGDSFLFRKKPNGSPPYKETWYGFGAILDGDHSNAEKEIKSHVKSKTGIEISVDEYLWWDSEIKKDLDDEVKFFIYLHSVSNFVSGELEASEGIEKLEWIPFNKLNDYDIVPPSRKFITRYINQSSDK